MCATTKALPVAAETACQLHSLFFCDGIVVHELLIDPAVKPLAVADQVFLQRVVVSVHRRAQSHLLSGHPRGRIPHLNLNQPPDVSCSR